MSDDELETPQTPLRPANPLSSELSPPDSQARPSESSVPAANTAAKMPPSATVNANGKRKWVTNGNDNVIQGLALAQQGGGSAVIMGRDPGSGYTWNKEEDAPGYSWNNHKAKEEASREFSRFADKDRMIKGGFGLCACLHLVLTLA
jgi:hypothetical protein